MGKRMILVALLFVVLCLSINAKEFTPDSKITAVTVYPEWARVTRTANIDIDSGMHSVKFENIPLIADESSFRVSAFGLDGAKLYGFNQTVEFHLEDPDKRAARIEELAQNIIRTRKQPLQSTSERLKQQKELLMGIGKTAGENMSGEIKSGSVNAAGWENAYGFFSNKMATLLDSIIFVENEISDITDSLKLLDAERRKTVEQNRNQTRTVSADFDISKAGKLTVEVEYLIPGANWYPIYDATFNPKTEKVEIGYYANILQQTGEDWEDVQLSLSTNRPSQALDPGQFAAWYLTPFEVSYLNKMRSNAELNNMIVPDAVDDMLSSTAGTVTTNEGELIIRGGRAGEVPYVLNGITIDKPLGGKKGPEPVKSVGYQYSLGDFEAVFSSPRKETIRSGGDPQKVPIGHFDLAGEVNLISRPKAAEGAFRQITMTNNTDFPLLPGVVSVFTESGFLGKTVFNEAVLSGNKITLGFGKDETMDIKRKIIESKKNVKGDKIKKEVTVRIIAENKGKAARKVKLEEPTPVSQDNRIKVKLGQFLPEPLNIGIDGRAEWSLDLAPAQVDTIIIKYEVEYPQELVITNLP